MNNIQWATLKFNPTEPKTSRPGELPPQHSALVAAEDGTETRIYFNPGIFSQLQGNDQILIEYRQGKWRLAKTQTPELLNLLQSRQPAPPPAMPPMPSAQATAAPPPPQQAQAADTVANDIELMAKIYNELGDRIDAPPEVLSSLSCTIFISNKKR